MPVHVSIHGVDPTNWSDARRLLFLARDRGLPCSVALAAAADSRFEPDGELVAELLTHQRAGRELLLIPVASAGAPPLADLDWGRAAARLDGALAALRAVGLAADGVVPPGWSMPDWMGGLLADRGLAYAEVGAFAVEPATARRTFAPLVWLAGPAERPALSTFALARAARLLSATTAVRVAVSPGVMRHKLLRDEVTSLLAWCAEGRAVSARQVLGGSAG